MKVTKHSGPAYRRNYHRSSAFAAALFVVCLGGQATAEPELDTPTTALRDAEFALQSVNYEAVAVAASKGLSAGNATLTETVRLHVLAGKAAASIGDGSRARKHFIAALAVVPHLDLERELSPKVRDPYLEALGFWGLHDVRLKVTVGYDARLGRLTFGTIDPAQLGRRIRLFFRVDGQRTFRREHREGARRVPFDLPGEACARGFDYYVELVDENGNRLYEIGSEDEPISVAARRSVAAPIGMSRSTSNEARPSYLLPVTLLATGLAAVGAAVYFNVRRESAAQEWNGANCEQPGSTRLQQCGRVDDDRLTMERLSITGYALGGALLATGGVLFWSSSSSRAEVVGASATGAVTPSGVGLSWRGTF